MKQKTLAASAVLASMFAGFAFAHTTVLANEETPEPLAEPVQNIDNPQLDSTAVYVDETKADHAEALSETAETAAPEDSAQLNEAEASQPQEDTESVDVPEETQAFTMTAPANASTQIVEIAAPKDLSTINSNYVMLETSEGGTINNFGQNAVKDLADQAIALNKQLGLVHKAYTGAAKDDALVEAEVFYDSVKDTIGKAAYFLDVDNVKDGGSVWIRNFLDYFTLMSGVKPTVLCGTGWDQYDWNMIAEKKDNIGYNYWWKMGSEYAYMNGAPDWNKMKTPVKAGQGRMRVIFRLYNDISSEHLYTAKISERNFLKNTIKEWNYEGIAWISGNQGEAVYRLYNPYLSDHLLTKDIDEITRLTTYYGWRLEDLVAYSSGDVGIYRLYNPFLHPGSHLFTTDKAEYDRLPAYDWRQENVKLYSYVKIDNKKSGKYVRMVLDHLAAFDENGHLLPDGYYEIDGKYYSVQGGVTALMTDVGWKFDSRGNAMYIDPASGKIASGLVKIGGSTFYFDPATKFMVKDKVIKFGESAYRAFGDNGVMVTGEHTLGTSKLVFNADGLFNYDLSTNRTVVCDKTLIHQDGQYQIWQGGKHIKNITDGIFLSLMNVVSKYEGDPYVWAGKSEREGFDCSGLTTYAMKYGLNYNINPYYVGADGLYWGYTTPITRQEAKAGDLVFFYGTYGSLGLISHVGIYCGDDIVYNAGDPIGYDNVDTFTNINNQPCKVIFGRIKL